MRKEAEMSKINAVNLRKSKWECMGEDGWQKGDDQTVIVVGFHLVTQEVQIKINSFFNGDCVHSRFIEPEYMEQLDVIASVFGLK